MGTIMAVAGGFVGLAGIFATFKAIHKASEKYRKIVDENDRLKRVIQGLETTKSTLLSEIDNMKIEMKALYRESEWAKNFRAKLRENGKKGAAVRHNKAAVQKTRKDMAEALKVGAR